MFGFHALPASGYHVPFSRGNWLLFTAFCLFGLPVPRALAVSLLGDVAVLPELKHNFETYGSNGSRHNSYDYSMSGTGDIIDADTPVSFTTTFTPLGTGSPPSTASTVFQKTGQDTDSITFSLDTDVLIYPGDSYENLEPYSPLRTLNLEYYLQVEALADTWLHVNRDIFFSDAISWVVGYGVMEMSTGVALVGFSEGRSYENIPPMYTRELELIKNPIQAIGPYDSLLLRAGQFYEIQLSSKLQLPAPFVSSAGIIALERGGIDAHLNFDLNFINATQIPEPRLWFPTALFMALIASRRIRIRQRGQ